MKIVIDVMGGDYAPLEMIKGCNMALQKDSSLELVLVGDEKIINDNIDANFKNNIEIINATEIISNDDAPAMAIRQKKDSSIVMAFDALKSRDDYRAIISCGSSGAVLAGGILKLGRIKGISRPALAPLLPTATNGKVLLIDAGANVDCKPENLYHFAQMGTAYMQALGNKCPKVALLSVGTEEHKGSELTKAAFDLIMADKNINFLGNMEARDALSGEYDVIVCDGFAGNVLLKSVEGTAKLVMSEIKNSFMSNLKTKICALLMNKNLKCVKGKLDYNKFGGAPFLGVNKIVIKSHGNSKAETISNSIMQAKELILNDVIGGITEKIIQKNNLE